MREQHAVHLSADMSECQGDPEDYGQEIINFSEEAMKTHHAVKHTLSAEAEDPHENIII